ncbi:GMP synthase [Microbacterium sp. LRZ72]|uniref:glutamine amidotransferase-related protein n=1 Tax=Microbacterium sp. LRZ72 TaxID=2942481 RepID=UPI0029B9E9D0|nr:GMP synthase [Microbacterium sp. LRZ72]MDX2376681.1 GMP synthase [Microbacterium sp. LRZ72]
MTHAPAGARPLLCVCARPQTEAAEAEYRSFLEAAQLPEPMLHAHDLVHDPLPAGVFDTYSGFVIGGSPFNVADPETSKTQSQRRMESELEQIAARAADGATAALFTCYGIGIVTRMLGGAVTRAYPEATGPASVELTADGADDPVFADLPPRFTALTAHKEGTGEAPPGAVLLARNDACPVQAYRVGTTLYATQFHPEPTAQAFIDRMQVYRNDGYFDVEQFEQIAERVRATPLTEPPRAVRAFAALAL